jgi:hypothetical protein
MAIPQRVWPAPEAEHMGGHMHKCWAGGFENMKQLKADVVNSLEDLGWTIEGDDNLRGVNFETTLWIGPHIQSLEPRNRDRCIALSQSEHVAVLISGTYSL